MGKSSANIIAAIPGLRLSDSARPVIPVEFGPFDMMKTGNAKFRPMLSSAFSCLGGVLWVSIPMLLKLSFVKGYKALSANL